MPPDTDDPIDAAFQAASTPPPTPDAEPLVEDAPDAGPDDAFLPADDAADDPWAELRGAHPNVFGKYGDNPAEWAKALDHAERVIAQRHEAPTQAPLAIPGLDLTEDEIMELAQRRPGDAARYVMEHQDDLPSDLTQSVLNFWVSVEPWAALQHQVGAMRDEMQSYVQQAQQPQVAYLQAEWAARVENLISERNADWKAYEDKVAYAINNGMVAVPPKAYESPEAMVRALENILGGVKYAEWQERTRANGGTPPTPPPRTQTRSSAPPPAPAAAGPGTGYLGSLSNDDIIADITRAI